MLIRAQQIKIYRIRIHGAMLNADPYGSGFEILDKSYWANPWKWRKTKKLFPVHKNLSYLISYRNRSLFVGIPTYSWLLLKHVNEGQEVGALDSVLVKVLRGSAKRKRILANPGQKNPHNNLAILRTYNYLQLQFTLTKLTTSLQ